MKWFDQFVDQRMYPECDTIEKIDRHLTYWQNLLGLSLRRVERFVYKFQGNYNYIIVPFKSMIEKLVVRCPAHFTNIMH